MRKLFTLFLILIVSAGTMFAEKVKIGDLYYNLDATNKTAEVTYEVAWNEDNYSGLTTTTIPSSVIYNEVEYSITSIGESAFNKCTGLTSIEIPNSVTSIGDYAFHGCTGLTSVTIGNSVTSIGDYVFLGCSDLTSVIVENGNTSFDSRDNCNAIIETATNTLIQGCKNTTIPNSVTSIGDYAFFCCSGLTSVTIPNSVNSIGEHAFDGCAVLISVTIPNSVTSIGNYAFIGCSGLTSVTIPNSVTSIENGAFEYCSGLTSVTIPNSVTSIGSWAFGGCYGLTSIEIPNGVTSIGNSAFWYCSGLTSVTIPNSVTSIGEDTFEDCRGLTSVIVEKGNTVYDSRDNCNAIIETATNTLIQGCMNTIIPNSVTGIGNSAFWYCSGLTSITIPNSVTSIGDCAFLGCRGLTSVTNYASTPQNIAPNVFDEVNKSTCTLYVPAGSVDAYKAAEGWKDFENIVGVDVPGEDPVETIPGDYSIYYVDKEKQELSDEIVTLHVPVAPVIAGFTFVGWQASGMLEDGITLQAVYEADEPASAPAVYTNPANPAQKLIRNGNVYILTGDNTYTLTGQKVK